MFNVRNTSIPGCCEIFAPVSRDERGYFIKTFHSDEFETLGLLSRFAEEYFTFSCHGVLRGLHFQIPPRELTKLVCCMQGEVMDVVVDLRNGSPAYGKHEIFKLSPERGNMVYIPPGLAHGFFVTGKSSVMAYKVTAVYSADHDKGILWNSVGVAWPSSSPILSQRDKGFPALSEFESPFVFRSV